MGVQINHRGPTISHIFFADNTLLLIKADKENCSNLVKLMKEYCEASGQQVSLQKFSVFFGSSVPVVLSKELGCILGIPIVDNLLWCAYHVGEIKKKWAHLC